MRRPLNSSTPNTNSTMDQETHDPQSDDEQNGAGHKEIVIAVMGVTGAGKSYFIRKVTGREDIDVGDGLESCKSFR